MARLSWKATTVETKNGAEHRIAAKLRRSGLDDEMIVRLLGLEPQYHDYSRWHWEAPTMGAPGLGRNA